MTFTSGLARRLAAVVLAAALPAAAHAEIIFGGDTKGLPGEVVELSVIARSGTVLEAIDIVPDTDAVADVLQFLGFDTTPALLENSSGPCAASGCALFYVEPKVFAADEMLARWRFRIADSAPVGPVPFDPNIVVGEDVVSLPAAAGFEVLAIPEPGTGWLLLVGGAALAAFIALTRRSRSNVRHRDFAQSRCRIAAS